MREEGSSSSGALNVVGHHLLTATSPASPTASVIDEAALLFDPQDVHWAEQGRNRFDLAVGIIGETGVGVVGSSFWMAAAHELRR